MQGNKAKIASVQTVDENGTIETIRMYVRPKRYVDAPTSGARFTSLRRRAKKRPGNSDMGGGTLRPWMLQSLIAAALLLAVIGLTSLPGEAGENMEQAVKSAMSMQVDLKGLGRIQLVQSLVPESVLVFWELGDTQVTFEPPLLNAKHAAESQKGVWYSSKEQAVLAAASGRVEKVEEGEGGYRVTLLHPSDIRTYYEPLKGVTVSSGQAVKQGDNIGIASQSDGEYWLHLSAKGQDDGLVDLP